MRSGSGGVFASARMSEIFRIFPFIARIFFYQLHNILAMAPSRTSTVKSKHASKHAANKSGIRNSKSSTKPQNDGVSKSKKPPKGKGPPPKPQKSAGNLATLKKKRRVYTEKELDIPALNMITPIGVEKPKGKKKGKVFVDDRVRNHLFSLKAAILYLTHILQESMMTILAMVNADKEGQIESKMMKARQMEEIREARKAEADKRQEMKKTKMEEAKDGARKKRKRPTGEDGTNTKEEAAPGTRPLKLKKKSVSFA